MRDQPRSSSVISNEVGANVEAQFEQGLMYANGHGVRKNKAKAIELYEAAAKQGHVEAQFSLGLMYEEGRGTPKNEAKAIDYYAQAAKQGHIEAQFNLGLMYEEGRGTAKDETQAIHYYAQAAKQGHVEAQFNLGLMYEEGHGTLADETQAIHYYAQAAEQGHVKAQFNLGLMYEEGRGALKSEAQAVHYYAQAVEQGHVKAQFNLGLMYEEGRGTPKDETQAIHCYAQAAEQGHVKAQFNLGLMYEEGRGAPKNEFQAVDYYTQAAKQGHAEAQFKLGLIYREGRGIRFHPTSATCYFEQAARQGHARAQFFLARYVYEKDNKAVAAGYYAKAAKQGHVEAQFNLGRLLIGIGTCAMQDCSFNELIMAVDDPDAVTSHSRFDRSMPRNEGRAKCISYGISYYEKAAEQGHVEAQFELGLMYEESPHVAKDVAKAAYYYEQAAKQGHVQAQFHLGLLCANGLGVSQDKNRAFDLFAQAAKQYHSGARFNLGLMYEERRAVTEAIKLFSEIAKGCKMAQTYLELMCANGDGIEESWAMMEKNMAGHLLGRGSAQAQFYRNFMFTAGHAAAEEKIRTTESCIKAVERGDASPAQYNNLGIAYEKGYGVKKSKTAAAYYYAQAANQGYAFAQCNLARMYEYMHGGIPKIQVKAVELYTQAAKSGNVNVYARLILGFMYADGRGTPKNEVKAQECFTQAAAEYRRAAEQGNAVAQFYLGFLYANGNGVTKDETIAIKLYEQAAEQGCALAQFGLGQMYALGRGVAVDKSRAFELFTQAAAQGFAAAKAQLGHILCPGATPGYYNDFFDFSAQDRGRHLLTQAAEQGNATAQYILGAMYASGVGIHQDETKAAQYYAQAAEQGHAKAAARAHALAQFNLALLHADGRGITKNLTRALELLRKAAWQGNSTAQYALICLWLENPETRSRSDRKLDYFPRHLVPENKKAILLSKEKFGRVYWLPSGDIILFPCSSEHLGSMPLAKNFSIVKSMLAQVIVTLADTHDELALSRESGKAVGQALAILAFSLVIARDIELAGLSNLSREQVLDETERHLAGTRPENITARSIILATLELLRHFLVEKPDQPPPIASAQGLTFFGGIDWRRLSSLGDDNFFAKSSRRRALVNN